MSENPAFQQPKAVFQRDDKKFLYSAWSPQLVASTTADRVISNSMWHAILLLFRESEKLAWYSRDAPLPSTSPLFATLTYPLALPAPPPRPSLVPLFPSWIVAVTTTIAEVSRLSCDPRYAPLHPLCVIRGRFLINPSTPLINDRCPFPFYDQRFRSPLIDVDHHGFSPLFHPVAKRRPGF